MDTSSWARSQLSSLLPLDPDSLNQILDYTSTLSTDAVAEHLKALLGDSPKALEFISSYNARREGATASPQGNNVQQQRTGNISAGEAPRTTRKQPKKKAPLHQLPSRKVEGFGEAGSGYKKGDGEDYMASTKAQQARQSNAFTLSETPEARLLPKKTAGKVPPSAAGNLISDLPNVKTKSQTTSRTASPAPKTKISVPGGVAGKGASTTLEDLVHSPSAFRSHIRSLTPNIGLCNSSPRATNKPHPQSHFYFLPNMQLQRNTPSPSHSSTQLPKLRQDNLRQRRPRPMYILLPPTPRPLRSPSNDYLPSSRARPSAPTSREHRPPKSRHHHIFLCLSTQPH